MKKVPKITILGKEKKMPAIFKREVCDHKLFYKSFYKFHDISKTVNNVSVHHQVKKGNKKKLQKLQKKAILGREKKYLAQDHCNS